MWSSVKSAGVVIGWSENLHTLGPPWHMIGYSCLRGNHGCESCAVAFTVTRSQTQLGDFGPPYLLHLHQNTKWGNIVWNNGVPSLQWSSGDRRDPPSGALELFWPLAVARHFTETLYVGFSTDFSPPARHSNPHGTRATGWSIGKRIPLGPGCHGDGC